MKKLACPGCGERCIPIGYKVKLLRGRDAVCCPACNAALGWGYLANRATWPSRFAVLALIPAAGLISVGAVWEISWLITIAPVLYILSLPVFTLLRNTVFSVVVLAGSSPLYQCVVHLYSAHDLRETYVYQMVNEHDPNDPYRIVFSSSYMIGEQKAECTFQIADSDVIGRPPIDAHEPLLLYYKNSAIGECTQISVYQTENIEPSQQANQDA